MLPPPGGLAPSRYPQDWRAPGRSLLAAHEGGENLATVVWPHLEELFALVGAGRGPCCLVCGSRGGQVTVGCVWENGWRGPTLCVNGGCAAGAFDVPPILRLVVTSGARDECFRGSDIRWCRTALARDVTSTGATVWPATPCKLLRLGEGRRGGGYPPAPFCRPRHPRSKFPRSVSLSEGVACVAVSLRNYRVVFL